jgi:hypothetical protein
MFGWTVSSTLLLSCCSVQLQLHVPNMLLVHFWWLNLALYSLKPGPEPGHVHVCPCAGSLL